MKNKCLLQLGLMLVLILWCTTYVDAKYPYFTSRCACEPLIGKDTCSCTANGLFPISNNDGHKSKGCIKAEADCDGMNTNARLSFLRKRK